MRVLRTAGRLLGAVLLTIAKTVGAIAEPGGVAGARTFDHDNATTVYRRRDEYRP